MACAAKDLDEESYASWASHYMSACASSTNRAAKVAAVCEELETGLTLLGATAVEDKLQEGVPEAVAALSAAGIKVWVLTGDKMETAISIGHTARWVVPSAGLCLCSLRTRAQATASAHGHHVGWCGRFFTLHPHILGPVLPACTLSAAFGAGCCTSAWPSCV